MSIVIENIINPKKALDNIKKMLFSFYIEDYGEESIDTIKSRWDNIIFVTDSLPSENKKFVDTYKEEIKDKMFIVRANLEYKDFMKKQKNISKAIKQSFEEFLRDRFQIFSGEQVKTFWHLKGTPDEVDTYGWNKVNEIIKEREFLLAARNVMYIEETLWGKRMQLKYRELSKEQLAEILFQTSFPAITCVLESKKKELKTVCHIPLIRYIKTPSLDRMVLHELRHAEETEGSRSGLSIFPNKKLDLLNEVRTEKHAIKDEQKLPLIFAREKDIPQSVYDLLIPTLEEYGDIEDSLDAMAFTGDFDRNSFYLKDMNNALERTYLDGNIYNIRVK